MALITTPGGSSSNSFVTITEADTYLAASTIIDATAWDTLTEAQKEERLVYAALLMKAQFMWIGWLVYRNQALPFPRWMPDEQDFDPATIHIPEAIKRAQAFMSLDIVHRGSIGLSPASDGNPKPDLKRLALFGSLDVTLGNTQHGASDPSRLGRMTQSGHWMIEQLLAPYSTTVQFTSATASNDAPDLLEEVTT